MIMADALIIGTVKEFIKSITAFCNCPTGTSYPKRTESFTYVFV